MTLSMPGPTGRPTTVKGTGMKALTMQAFTPEQLNLFRQLFGLAAPESFLGRLAGGSPEMFEQVEAPALRQFGAVQGGLASRFSGMGTGARRSSGFQNTVNTAAQQFAQDLQAQRLGLQRQATADLAGIASALLGQRPFETGLVAKKQPFLKEFLAGIAPGIGQGIGSLPGFFL